MKLSYSFQNGYKYLPCHTIQHRIVAMQRKRHTAQEEIVVQYLVILNTKKEDTHEYNYIALFFVMMLLPTSAHAQAACGDYSDPDLGQPACDKVFWAANPAEAISKPAVLDCHSCYSDALALCILTEGAIVEYAQCLPNSSRVSVTMADPRTQTPINLW